MVPTEDKELIVDRRDLVKGSKNKLNEFCGFVESWCPGRIATHRLPVTVQATGANNKESGPSLPTLSFSDGDGSNSLHLGTRQVTRHSHQKLQHGSLRPSSIHVIRPYMARSTQSSGLQFNNSKTPNNAMQVGYIQRPLKPNP